MKNFIKEIFLGKNVKISALMALAVIGSIVLGCNCNKEIDLGNLTNKADNTGTTSTPKTETGDESVPSDQVVEALVKETTAEFAGAIDSEDFEEIYNNASSDFQNTYTLAEMKTAFKSYIDKKSVVLPILKKVGASDADFTRPASIRTERGLKILVAEGKFPTKPYNVRFDYEYVMRGGEWKLLKLVINIP